ncbi:MAG: amino acid ABC transporter permease [Eubacteriales bacterium]|nr:amino acid ABC transporter permease [Eubacteriales bacterium]
MLESLLDPWRWERSFQDFPDYLSGFGMTLRVTVVGWLIAMAIGILLGLISTKKSRVLKVIYQVYVQFFQNTPVTIQFFFFYVGVPVIIKQLFQMSRTYRLSKFVIGIFGVGLYHGAYIAEIIRSGIQAVPVGQREAACSQGFTENQAMVHIILPQTLRMILPPLASQTLALLKNTSTLAMVVGLDLMYFADKSVGYTGYFQGYLIAAAMYFAVCFPLAILVRVLEKNAARTPGLSGRRRRTAKEAV